MKNPWVVVPFWLVAVAGGMIALGRYQGLAGSRGVVPQQWPAQLAALDAPREGERSVLVMALHPKCPCSRASVAELERIMAASDRALTARVLIVIPDGANEDFAETSLVQRVRSIPGVITMTDPLGKTSASLGLETSGHVLLFSSSGQRLFSGGITQGRGHEGDNDGVSSILDLVAGKTAHRTETPVFGCSLNSCQTADAISKPAEQAR